MMVQHTPGDRNEHSAMRNIIAIGGLAGSTQALRDLFSNLPAELPAILLVATHFPGSDYDHLPSVLRRSGSFPVKTAEDGEPIRLGQAYVAVADRHLLVRNGRVRLVRGPTENRFRPAIDPLFRSVAVEFGPRAVGIVLSGALNDGTSGLRAIKRCGGVAIVQDPDDALHPSMPRSAQRHVNFDHILPARAIGSILAELSEQEVNLQAAPPVPQDIKIELAMTEQTMNGIEGNKELGRGTMFTCPDCGCVLSEIEHDDLQRYRCHVGHSYTAEAMMISQSESLEHSLWAAIAALQQRAKLCESLLERARASKLTHTIRDLERQIRESYKHAAVLRRMVLRGQEFSHNQEPSVRTSRQFEPSDAPSP